MNQFNPFTDLSPVDKDRAIEQLGGATENNLRQLQFRLRFTSEYTKQFLNILKDKNKSFKRDLDRIKVLDERLKRNIPIIPGMAGVAGNIFGEEGYPPGPFKGLPPFPFDLPGNIPRGPRQPTPQPSPVPVPVPDTVEEPKKVPQPEQTPQPAPAPIPFPFPGIPGIPIPRIPELERGLSFLEKEVEKFFESPASLVLGVGGFGFGVKSLFPLGARTLARVNPKLAEKLFKKPPTPPQGPPTSPPPQGQPPKKPKVNVLEPELTPPTPEPTPVPRAPRGQQSLPGLGRSLDRGIGKGAQKRAQAESDAATDMMGDRLRELGKSLRETRKPTGETLGPARPPVRGDELQKFIDNPVIKPGSIADFMNLGDKDIRRKFIEYMKGAAKTKEGKPNFGMHAKFLRQMDLVEDAAAPPKIDDNMFKFILNFFKKYRLSPTKTIDKMKESGMVEETTLKNPNIKQLINRAERAADPPRKQFRQPEPSKKGLDTSSIKYNTGFDTLIVIMRPRPRPSTVNV